MVYFLKETYRENYYHFMISSYYHTTRKTTREVRREIYLDCATTKEPSKCIKSFTI